MKEKTIKNPVSSPPAEKPSQTHRNADVASMIQPNVLANPPRKEGAFLSEIFPEHVELHAESRLAFHTEPHGSAADRYRLLRQRLRELKAKSKLKTIMVTSPLPGDGKTTTVLNLATALADKGRSRVLVVEADYYHPSIVGLLGIKESDGLAGILEDGASPAESIRRLEPLAWSLIPAGSPAGIPTELHQRDSFTELLLALKPHFDWILIDSPPVVPLADALLLREQTDATLLVARAGFTPKRALDQAVAALGKQHVLGIVLNATDGVNRLYNKYSKYYGNYRGKGREQKLVAAPTS